MVPRSKCEFCTSSHGCCEYSEYSIHSVKSDTIIESFVIQLLPSLPSPPPPPPGGFVGGPFVTGDLI
jgi:hypothetical protein